MHIGKIRIENVKRFGEGAACVDLDFTLAGQRTNLAGWTVLAGPNGSGKTTFLQAIALALVTPYAHEEPSNNLQPWIRNGATNAWVVSELHRDVQDDPLDGLNHQTIQRGVEWLKTRATWKHENTFQITSDSPQDDSDVPDQARLTMNEEIRGWFLAGYGPTRRVVGRLDDVNGAAERYPRRMATMGLLRQDAYLFEGISRLKDLDYRRLKSDSKAREMLEWVINLLEDDLLPGGMKIIGVEPDGLIVDDGGAKLHLRSLSDGYRTTVAFIIDLVMRMASVYRERMRVEYTNDGRPIIRHSGIVLIDEMELHLHPSWQQKIGFWLKQHFPNIQFFVTTHSPFVCQAADVLVRFSSPDEGRPVAQIVDEQTFRQVVTGGADEAVVSDLFGLSYPHAARVEVMRERLAALEARELRGALAPDERSELDKLQKDLPYAPGSSVERILRKATASR